MKLRYEIEKITDFITVWVWLDYNGFHVGYLDPDQSGYRLATQTQSLMKAIKTTATVVSPHTPVEGDIPSVDDILTHLYRSFETNEPDPDPLHESDRGYNPAGETVLQP